MFARKGVKGPVDLIRRMTTIVLVLIVLFGSFPVGKASAWSYYGSTGQPGQIYIQPITIQDVFKYCTTVDCYYQFTLTSQTGPLVYRSSSPYGTGVQDVAATYVVQQYIAPNWVNILQVGPFNQKIQVGSSYTIFPAPNLKPPVARGIFRVVWFFAWSTSAGTLAGTAVIPNLTSDHACATIQRLCQSYPTYFQTGGYRTGKW